ncbi:MAG: hypothetical protein EOP85_11340 [Verrucomicrobiaceae bacterium]|nr:MAG: hypothetical protein EOP85_11340 [Verrucomicrobiaceae bacterium]
MSSSTKPTSSKGVRYTDAQKKEVIDFALAHNASQGRGGQSKAAEKFNISPLTVAAWLKSSGSKVAKSTKAPKASKAKPVKAAKAPKATKVRKTASAKGVRYTDEQKQEVVSFVVSHNAEHGRGGPSKAAKKFKLSPLTVASWVKSAGVKLSNKKIGGKTKYVAPGKAAKVSAKGSQGTKGLGDIGAKLNSLLDLSKQIAKAESELEQLRSRFDSLKKSL